MDTARYIYSHNKGLSRPLFYFIVCGLPASDGAECHLKRPGKGKIKKYAKIKLLIHTAAASVTTKLATMHMVVAIVPTTIAISVMWRTVCAVAITSAVMPLAMI